MSVARYDWSSEGLLEGLYGTAREQRTALLDELAARGVPIDDLRGAVSEGRLAALPAELALGGIPRHSARDSAIHNGTDLEFVLAMRRANGTPVLDPDLPIISDAELRIGEQLAQLTASGITQEQMEVSARVMGSALRPLAEVLTEVIFELAYDPELGELELAEQFVDHVTRLAPSIGAIVEANLELHLREAVRDAAISAAASRSSEQPPGTRDIAVAFADLVGFTRLGEELPPGELERVASRLGTLASDLLRPPVRLVKLIGDAAMLVSPDPEPLVATALDLVAAADAAGAAFPQLRAGLAFGPAVSRSGDWYGRPVNLASRLTSIARAGSVVATAELRERATADQFRWSEAGRRKIRGVPGAVPIHRVRRAG